MLVVGFVFVFLKMLWALVGQWPFRRYEADFASASTTVDLSKQHKEYPGMSRSAIICVLSTLCIGIVMTGCAPRPDWNRAVHSSELDRAGLDYQWQNTIPLDRFERLRKIVQLDENLYCLSSNNTLFAFDAKTGTSIWSRELTGKKMSILGLAHADKVMLPNVIDERNVTVGETGIRRPVDLLVVTTIAEAIIINRSSGDILHRVAFSRANFLANTAPACDSVRFFVGGLTGWCHAIEFANGIEAWKVFTAGPLSATPVVVNNGLFLADEKGVVYSHAISKNDSERNWPQSGFTPQAESRIVADMAATSEAIYVGSGDYSVYAFEPTTGKRLWRFRCGGPLLNTVLAGRTNVYAYAKGNAFYAIDRAGRDTAKWMMPEGRDILAEIGDTAYVLDNRNYLVCVDVETGKPSISVPLTGLNLFTPNVKTPAIYAANDQGLVCCIKLKH